MSIGQFTNRITVKRYASTKSASGGLQAVLSAEWSKLAKIESRSGSVRVDSNQKQWSYDYKITLRYTPSQVERSDDVVEYDGKKLLIRSVSFENEGAKKFVILRCSTNE